MKTELKAPAGKVRIVGIDLFDRTDYLVGDYEDKSTAFQIADEHNENRSGSMDDVYYVYDDKGIYIRGNEAVGQPITP